MNLKSRDCPALTVLAFLGAGAFSALALAPTETTAQPAPLPPTPFKVACAPVGSSRSFSRDGKIVRATTSMGVSTENPDYCLLNTSKGPKNYFLGSMSTPSPDGRVDAAEKIRALISGRVQKVEFDLVWLGTIALKDTLKLHEEWQYMGTGVLPMENGPLNVVTVRLHIRQIIGGDGEGILVMIYPLVNGEVLLMPVAQNVPDPDKALGLRPFRASRFDLPVGYKHN